MTESNASALAQLVTEEADPRYRDLDRMSILEIAQRMNDADTEVPAAVGRALPSIAEAVEAIVPRMQAGGRLLYVGAGTSGRLAVLDAAECPPTFNTPPEQVQAIIAGGAAAITGPVEGAEDDVDAGAVAVAERSVTSGDVVVGVAASGRTPFVLGAVAEAHRRGALTVGVSCNTATPLSARVDRPIEVPVGPEVVAGSTRLRAGTAQKLVLNMISTITMVRLGKTYGNLMVDLQASNSKLVARVVRMITEITGVAPDAAEAALEEAGRDVKTAVLILECGVDAAEARALLATARGRLADALAAGAAARRNGAVRDGGEVASRSGSGGGS